MIVYLVMYYDYDSTQLEGVFATEGLAQAHIENQINKINRPLISYKNKTIEETYELMKKDLRDALEIEEHEVQE